MDFTRYSVKNSINFSKAQTYTIILWDAWPSALLNNLVLDTAPLFEGLSTSVDVTQGIIKDPRGLKCMKYTSDKIRKATCIPTTNSQNIS